MKQAVCPACRSANRIGEGDPRAAKCGRCGEKLFTGEPVDVDDAGLQTHINLSSGPVLVDVWAPWCGPCRTMAPHFAATARQLEPDVRFLKLNADDNASPRALGVRGIPALILFHGGREIARHAGLMSSDQLVRWLKETVDAVRSQETRA